MSNETPWESEAQQKNLAWYLPRPKNDKYKGGMPLHCEQWLINLAEKVLDQDLETTEILQPFAGGAKEGVRVDIKENTTADLIGDAHNLPFKDKSFKLVICDPPYSDQEAEELYSTPELSHKDWTQEAVRVTEPGGLLVLYHKKLIPNPAPEKLSLEKQVLIASRPWHLPRIARYYRKS